MAANQLKNAIELAKSGDLVTARQAFVAIIKSEPQEVLAWLWLVDLLDTDEEKIQVLERCSKINSDDPMVRDALAHFREQQSAASPNPEQEVPDVRSVYEQEKKLPPSQKLKQLLKPVFWLLLLSGIFAGIYFGVPLLKTLNLPILALNGSATPKGMAPIAATWTPPATGTPTLTPTPTPLLPLGFGTPGPQPAAPISFWDADQLLAFAQWGNGTLLGLHIDPDGNIFALNSRGINLFSFASGESLEHFKSDTAWQAAVMDDAGEWLLYSSVEQGLNLVEVAAMKNPLPLEENQGQWNFLAIAPDASSAAAVNNNNELLVWNLPDGSLRFKISQGYGQIRSLAFSPDGDTIAIGGSVGFIWLLDAQSGTEGVRFFDLEGSVNALAYSADGLWLASAGVPQTIAIWDLETAKIHHHIYQEEEGVSRLRFSPDKSSLAVGLTNGEILLWNDSRREFQDQFSRHHASILDLSFTADGGSLCSAAQDGALLCWDLSNILSYQTIYPNIAGSIFTSAITPNGKYLILAGSGSQIHILDLASQTEVAALKGHLGSVYALAVSADGNNLLSGGRDGTIRLWSLETYEAIATLGSHAGYARSVAFSPDANLAASAGDDEMVKLWDLQTLSERRTLIGHTDRVQSVSFAPDGLTLFSGGDDASVRQWDVQDGRLMNTFESSDLQAIYNIHILPDGKNLISGSDAGILTFWDLQSGQIQAHLRGHENSINTITSSSDGRILATGDAQGRLIFWDIRSLERIRVLDLHSNPLVGLAFTANTKAFFSTDRSGMVLRWDSEVLQPPAAFGDFTSLLTAAAISPGGSLAAIAGVDRSIRVIDLNQGTLRYHIRGLEFDITELAFSPGGTHLVAGFSDGSIHFWAGSSGAEQLSIAGTENSVTALCFEPSGQVLLVGRDNHIIERRDVRSGNILDSMPGHSAAVTSLSFAPNQVTLASGSRDGMVFLWDTDDNSIMHRINAHSQAVTGLQFAPNSETLYSSSLDGFIYAWRTTNAAESFALSSEEALTSLMLDDSGELLLSGNDHGFCSWNTVQQSPGACHLTGFSQPLSMQFLETNEGLLVIDADGIIQRLAVKESHVPEITPTNPVQNTQPVGEMADPTPMISVLSLPAPLYYLSDVNGSQQIWRMESDGRTVRQITNEEQAVTAYDVSRVADHIVYITGNDLVLIDKSAQNRWVLVDGEDYSPGQNDARLQYEISAPVFSPDGWRVAYALNGVHIYSILDNEDDLLRENELSPGSLDNTLHTPIYFSPGGNNLYIQQTDSTGKALIVLSSWTGEVYNGPLAGPCCQPVMNSEQDAVIFTGIDKYNNSVGLWIIDVWYDELIELLPQPPSDKAHQVNAFPKPMGDGSFYFFFAQSEGNEKPALMLAKAADDGTSLLQVIRADSYVDLKEVLWAEDGSFVLVRDPADGTIKKLMTTDSPPILLPISGTMMRWGE